MYIKACDHKEKDITVHNYPGNYYIVFSDTVPVSNNLAVNAKYRLYSPENIFTWAAENRTPDARTISACTDALTDCTTEMLKHLESRGLLLLPSRECLDHCCSP